MLLSLSWLFFLPLCAMNTRSSHAPKDFQLFKPQKLSFNRNTQSVPAAANLLPANIMDSIELDLE